MRASNFKYEREVSELNYEIIKIKNSNYELYIDNTFRFLKNLNFIIRTKISYEKKKVKHLYRKNNSTTKKNMEK